MDLGGVKSTNPVLLSLSLLFLIPSKLFRFSQQELQIIGRGVVTHPGAADPEGKAFI